MEDDNYVGKLIHNIASITEYDGEITRRTFSPAWQQSLKYIRTEMEKQSMITHIDAFGNLVGRYIPEKGWNGIKKPLAIGSHIDTVRNGGAFDGVVGIVAGLEAVSRIRKGNIYIDRPIDVIAFSEEEGSVFGVGCLGSRYATGNIKLEEIEKLISKDGKTFEKVAEEAGFSLKAMADDIGWLNGCYDSFLEVHVEQGNRLEANKKQIGIVKGIVAISRFSVRFSGEANHAGTTAMDKRKDALVAASDFVVKVSEYGRKMWPKLVATTGSCDVFPNQQNVIPGIVNLTVELRSNDDGFIEKGMAELKKEAQVSGIKYGVEVQMLNETIIPVQYMSEDVINKLSKLNAEDNSMSIFSWAGHDAKILAKYMETGMLFVPSRQGKSHCSDEYTSLQDILCASELLVLYITNNNI